MNWSESISRAIEYIENNLTNNITTQEIANYSYISSFYFQKAFSIICGYSVSEYIRNRRLSLAATELLNTSTEIPKVWTTFFKKNSFSKIKPKYAINFDTNMSGDTFDYMICDDYDEDIKVPKGFEIVEIPKFTWAIFICIGPTNIKMPEINEKIFTEWLPNSNDYEIAAGYNIEMYSNPKDYKKGINDKEYYSEIWIPIKKKLK